MSPPNQKQPRDSSRDEPGPSAPQQPDGSYFPNTGGSAAPLEPTRDTIIASRTDLAQDADIPASGSGTRTTEQPPAAPTTSNPPPSQARSVPFQSLRSQPSAIRLRRLRAPSGSGSRLTPVATNPQPPRSRQQDDHDAVTGRRRSSSEPISPGALANARVINMNPMPVVPEGQTPPVYVAEGTKNKHGKPEVVVPRRFMMRRRRGNSKAQPPTDATADDCYDSKVVDFLDVVDPEVATLSSITNIQNSLFVPSLGRWVNRRPTYDLTSLPFIPGAFPPSKEDVSSIKEGDETGGSEGDLPAMGRTHSFSTVLTSTPQYAILPDDHNLEGWDEEDIKLLNDHVRHLLHSRRSKIKQQLKAFGKYASRPLGFLITLYATLITLFGLAWVLFLIGWIYVGEKQLYAIEVIDNVLVALFAVVGDGMIPWRLRDTYYMIWIHHYWRKTLKLRKKLLLPKLENKNDLPMDPNNPPDVEAQPQHKKEDDFFPVLTEEEQAKLVHYQNKFSKSHTFYKPHESMSHRAFPHRLMVAVVLLLDLHSCLQISLGLLTWCIPYERRPAAATTTVLCCSITVNCLAGVLISIGDRKTRKKDVVERLVRQELTGEVMDKMLKDKRKEEEKQREKVEKEQDKEEGKAGLLGLASMNLPDITGRKDSMKSPRGSSEEKWGSRRSLDALTEGFKRKSLDGSRGEKKKDDAKSMSSRKEKDKVGRFDPAAGVSSGLGSVAEADHEPYYHQSGHGDAEEKKMKVPGAFEG